MNKFGGDWTENKIEILVQYAIAYLTIMKPKTLKYNWQLLYFEGFAGHIEFKRYINSAFRQTSHFFKRVLNGRTYDEMPEIEL